MYYLTFKIEKVKSHLGIIRDYCEAAKEEADLAWKLNQDDVNSLLQQSIGNIEKQMTEQQLVLYRQDRLRFKSWLTPVEVDDRMKFILRVRTPDTGNWIFNDPHFRAWAFGDRRGKTNNKPLLWLSAGPGFGKSVLTAFVTSDLRRSNPTGIAYFPCSSNEADRRSIPAMLRTLIHQLFRDDAITGKPHYTVTPANINLQQGLPQPNMTSLVDMFKYKSWEEPNKTTVLIIDALDECPKTEESEVQIEQLFTLFAELPPSWKIMFTSRRAPWFEELLEGLPQGKLERLVMTKRDNEQDIYAYTLHQLDEMAKASNYKWQDGFRHEMEESIARKSEGMFKWTYLALKTLGGSRIYQSDMEEARKALDKVPPDLKGIYEKALRGLSEVEDETTREDLTSALRWIIRAYRPLKVKELGIGLAQAFDETEQIDDLREKLERHLGDLIYIDAKSDTVGLTHTSARDFLVTSQDIKGPDGKSMIPNQLGEIDRDILQACLTYLNDRQFLDAQPGDSKTQKAFNDNLIADGFWEYSCIGILQHLDEVCRTQQLDEKIKVLLDVFFRSDKNQVFLRWLQMFCYLRFTNRNGAAEAYSTLLDALLDMDSGATKPLASFLKHKFQDVVDHIGYSAGGRFLRWQRFFTHAISPCFSPTLLASFFNFRPALELLAKGNETLHYKNNGARCDAVYWSTCGDAPEALALMLSDEYNHRFPHFKVPTNNRHGLGQPSTMIEAVWLPMEIKARPGSYPAAIMLLDHGARISWGFETIVFEQLPDTEGAGELAKKMLRINRAFTFSDDAVGRALHFAAFTGQSHMLSAFWESKDLLRNLVKETFRKEDVDDILKKDSSIQKQLAFARWRGMSPMHHAAANDDAQSVRILCHNVARLDDMKCNFNAWTVMHVRRPYNLLEMKY
ncbi:uncharacterized protein N0V89_011267 [Didymosphaeria variabile]|uniref:NACHT domain-containing protein n=1 Tax=Didymosphaeria variabile TaxID=1932322 RepID=A0A9W8XEW6_9PLEO|nr:uncharacterized protein N0V89_011267 [Didymosphaeria variabile]KAJ4347326.1 hypothetical protein N0V89_011267 [Didymosphaeria variabile]